MTSESVNWSLIEAAEAIVQKKISAEELTRESLQAAENWHSSINAFLEIDSEVALSAARLTDKATVRGEIKGRLHGVPLAHKDLFYRREKAISCGSKVLNGFQADFDATVLHRLHNDAGAINIGRLNMAEIAVGATGRNEHFGHCRNPWNVDRMTGGSSSGSGAAVAARNVFGSLGTDTGGSIRIPSAACGLVGMKATFGRVSRSGVMPLSYSLDNAGPMARTVRDCARLFGVIAGYDPADPMTSSEPVPDYESLLEKFNVKGKKIGIPSSYFYDTVQESIRRALELSLEVYRGLGAEIVEVEVPDQIVLRDMTNLILKAEVANIHGQWLRNCPNEYQAEVRARIESGLYIPAVDYLRALRLRGKHAKNFVETVFDSCDILHTPTLPIEPPTLAEIDMAVSQDALSINEKIPWCTRPLNYLGLPGLTIPCGFSESDMPIGFQLIGRPFSEDLLFQVGHAYQRETDWHKRAPILHN